MQGWNGLTLQTLETRMSEPSTPTHLLKFPQYSVRALGSLPVVFFRPWCFESVPVSYTVAKCSLPVAPAVCALHMRNGWISHSFGELRKNGHLLTLIYFQTYVALSVKYILKSCCFWTPLTFIVWTGDRKQRYVMCNMLLRICYIIIWKHINPTSIFLW